MIKTIFSIIALNMCLFGQVAEQVQAPKSEYKVANVYILLDADTRYLRKLANRTISRDKANHSAEIDCFKRNLLKSGLFSDFDFRFSKLPGTDTYDLTLIARYKKNPPVYEIQEVISSGFGNLDATKLNDLLGSILGQTRKIDLRYDFAQLETIVVGGLGKLDNQVDLDPWIELTLNDNNKIVVTVLPEFCGCP